MVNDFMRQRLAEMPAALYRAYLGTVMPAVGWIFHGDADTYAYIPASLESYPAQRGVEALMRQAGFGRVRYEEIGRHAGHRRDSLRAFTFQGIRRRLSRAGCWIADAG